MHVLSFQSSRTCYAIDATVNCSLYVETKSLRNDDLQMTRTFVSSKRRIIRQVEKVTTWPISIAPKDVFAQEEWTDTKVSH